MEDIVKPVACKVLEVKRESLHKYIYGVETDIKPEHGQFLQLFIPKIGEAPISMSSFGEDYMDFTIRSVDKVTDVMFEEKAGGILFLHGAYGKGWPIDQFKGKHMVAIARGTGFAPVKSMLNMFYDNPDLVKNVHLISGFKNEKGIIFKGDLRRWSRRFDTIYAPDKDHKDGWETGFVTESVSRIPFKDLGEDYAVMVVGPPPMMKFIGFEVLKQGVPEEKIWVSPERKMSCAVGKCEHRRIDEVYVCLDGLVFNYTQAKYLVD